MYGLNKSNSSSIQAFMSEHIIKLQNTVLQKDCCYSIKFLFPKLLITHLQ